MFAAIVQDIEALKPQCPHLATFDPRVHATPSSQIISFQHHVRPSGVPGGWQAGIPVPDPDGVVLYVAVADVPAGQLSRQSGNLTRYQAAGSEIGVLVLEGDKVSRCSGAIHASIEKRAAAAENAAK